MEFVFFFFFLFCFFATLPPSQGLTLTAQHFAPFFWYMAQSGPAAVGAAAAVPAPRSRAECTAPAMG